MNRLPNKTEKQGAPNPKQFSVPATAITVVLCCAAIVALDKLQIKLFDFSAISLESRIAFKAIIALLCAYLPFVCIIYKINSNGEPFKQWYQDLPRYSEVKFLLQIVSMFVSIPAAVLVFVFVVNL